MSAVFVFPDEADADPGSIGKLLLGHIGMLALA